MTHDQDGATKENEEIWGWREIIVRYAVLLGMLCIILLEMWIVYDGKVKDVAEQAANEGRRSELGFYELHRYFGGGAVSGFVFEKPWSDIQLFCITYRDGYQKAFALGDGLSSPSRLRPFPEACVQ